MAPKPDPHPSARRRKPRKKRKLTPQEIAAIIRGSGVQGKKRTKAYNDQGRMPGSGPRPQMGGKPPAKRKFVRSAAGSQAKKSKPAGAATVSLAALNMGGLKKSGTKTRSGAKTKKWSRSKKA